MVLCGVLGSGVGTFASVARYDGGGDSSPAVDISTSRLETNGAHKASLRTTADIDRIECKEDEYFCLVWDFQKQSSLSLFVIEANKAGLIPYYF